MNTAVYPIINEERGLPFVVCGIGSQTNQCHIVRNEGYHLHQFIFTSNGTGLLQLNGQQIEITKETFIYLKPGEPHEYCKQTESWATDWILFSGDHIERTLDKLGFSKSKTGCVQNGVYVRKLLSDIMNSLNGRDPYKAFTASNLLYMLLIELYRSSNEKNCTIYSQEACIISPIIDYINGHFFEELSLDALADLANITPQHLCKLFKKHLNMRPFEYIAKMRMQEAKKLLISGNLTIKSIGESVGYKDSSYFCALFRKYERISPAEFRGSSQKTDQAHCR
jgi:AraC-like DNA-binding protein